MILVVAFALILIVFFLVPALRNDLFRLTEMKEGEDLINLTHSKGDGIEVVDANEEIKIREEETNGNKGGGDGVLKSLTLLPKKGPPRKIKSQRRFHFAAAVGKGGMKDYEEISLNSNKSLEFHGPSNARQVCLNSHG